MAHNAADQVFETLTGVPGAFSTRLLYVTANRLSVNNTNYTLNRSDYDGHRSATLLTSKEPILSPSFSPDGHHVSYVSFEKRKPRIFLQDISNGKREQLTDFPGLNGAPAWSPDGKKLAFVLSKDGNPEIYVMTLATHSLQRVTNQYAIDTEPFWGKDNQTIYFTSDRSGKPQIYKTQLGGSVNRVTFVGNYNAKPTLSADEKTLVMIHRQEGYTVFNVAAQDLKTGRIHLLSNSKLDESPTIAPNGTMLVYATHQNGKSVLILASINGRVKFTLPTVQGDMREPSWSPYLK
ncbi:UNVERIFIED_CONTAM: hypothetical protein GTU68_008992 [Idotea baltica]|nr:hypothetical protein [Idotea baltica]